MVRNKLRILNPKDNKKLNSCNWWYLNAGNNQTRAKYPANISTSNQRCFNVVDQRWNNVDLTLKMKKIRRRFLNHNVDKTSHPDVEITSKQRCITLYQCCFNVASRCWNHMETNRTIDYGFINRLIIFIHLSETIFFTICY